MMETFKPALILLTICFVTVAMVAAVNSFTQEQISNINKKEEESTMKEVLPGVDSFDTVALNYFDEDRRVTLHHMNKGFKEEEPIGYEFVTQTMGYAGAMTIIVGIDTQGKVTGVMLGDNSETAGLGSKIGETTFVKQFIGREISNLTVVTGKPASADNEIDAVTFATISSKGMTNAVNAVLAYYNEMMKGE